MRKARGRLGSYLPVSMALTVWRLTPRRLGEVGLGPAAFGAEFAEGVLHSQRFLATKPPMIQRVAMTGHTNHQLMRGSPAKSRKP